MAMEEEGLGFWELVHGTSAGGASIAAWESLRTVVSGVALLVLYTMLTAALFKWHHWHLMRIKRAKARLRAEIEE